jgi:hypothetical protein
MHELNSDFRYRHRSVIHFIMTTAISRARIRMVEPLGTSLISMVFPRAVIAPIPRRFRLEMVLIVMMIYIHISTRSFSNRLVCIWRSRGRIAATGATSRRRGSPVIVTLLWRISSSAISGLRLRRSSTPVLFFELFG